MRNFNTVCAHLYVYVLLNVNPPLLLTFLRHHISYISSFLPIIPRWGFIKFAEKNLFQFGYEW